jgi:hypothetical protein
LPNAEEFKVYNKEVGKYEKQNAKRKMKIKSTLSHRKFYSEIEKISWRRFFMFPRLGLRQIGNRHCNNGN